MALCAGSAAGGSPGGMGIPADCWGRLRRDGTGCALELAFGRVGRPGGHTGFI